MERDFEPVATELQTRLAAMFAGIARKRVIVAFSTTGAVHYAGVSSDAECGADPAEWIFPTGCITKLFTGALIGHTFDARGIGIDAPVTRWLTGTDIAAVLRGVTARQLLEHTHGLDDAAIGFAPLRADGRLDIERLCAALAVPRIAAPGAYYSYGNAGAWLAAGVLESLHDECFESQLRQRLFAPLGVTPRSVQPSWVPELSNGICAAMGGTLAVSARDLLRLVATLIGHESNAFCPNSRAAAIGSRMVALPGWHPTERGISRGWKYYGGAWFGHQSVWPGTSVVLRVQLYTGRVILVVSRDHPAVAITAKLFPACLPEFRHLSVPKPEAGTADRRDLRPYLGCYRSAADTLLITAREAAQLRLTGTGLDCALAPAANDLFFTRPPDVRSFPFVQFLQRDRDGFAYLWNGRRLFRRQPVSEA